MNKHNGSERPHATAQVLLYLGLAILGTTEAIAVYLWDPPWTIRIGLHLVYACLTCCIILVLGRAVRSRDYPAWAAILILAATFVVTGVLAQVPMKALLNSGDEFGYNYIADTLLHGRLWNNPLPPPIRDVLETYYVADQDGHRLSQYPPGWPAVLAMFKLVGVPQFANATIGLLAGLFLLLTLRQLDVPNNVRLAALILGTAAPFTLFNDASFFNHTLTAAAIMGVIWLDLRNMASPSPGNLLGLGFAFSILLSTRYETFLIAAVLYGAEALIRRRSGLAKQSMLIAMGATPITLLFLLYNWLITGSPFKTTLTYISPEIGFGPYSIGVDGQHSPMRGLEHTVEWLLTWHDFASVLLLPLYSVALWFRIQHRTVRWYDLIFPALVVFFFFYPDSGGFQYGPRYYYIGHVVMPITIAAGLPLTGGLLRWRGWALDPARLALAQCSAFIGFTVGYSVFLDRQVEVRTTPQRVAANLPSPVMVLIADHQQRYVDWEHGRHWMMSKDYTRIGVDGELRSVAFGRDLGDARTQLLCTQLPDRTIYRLRMDPSGPRAWLDAVCNPKSADTHGG